MSKVIKPILLVMTIVCVAPTAALGLSTKATHTAIVEAAEVQVPEGSGLNAESVSHWATDRFIAALSRRRGLSVQSRQDIDLFFGGETAAADWIISSSLVVEEDGSLFQVTCKYTDGRSFSYEGQGKSNAMAIIIRQVAEEIEPSLGRSARSEDVADAESDQEANNNPDHEKDQRLPGRPASAETIHLSMKEFGQLIALDAHSRSGSFLEALQVLRSIRPEARYSEEFQSVKDRIVAADLATRPGTSYSEMVLLGDAATAAILADGEIEDADVRVLVDVGTDKANAALVHRFSDLSMRSKNTILGHSRLSQAQWQAVLVPRHA